MSGGAQTSVGVSSGKTTRTSLGLRSSHVCQLPKTVTFEMSRSFVEATAENKAAFAELLTRLSLPTKQNRLLITGFTDATGPDSINRPLSERRAKALRAVLKGDPEGTAQWEELYQKEGWGTAELTMMVAEVGETDVAPYRGPDKKDARRDLYRRYFQRLLGGRAVPTVTPTTPDILFCGARHLLRGDPNNPSKDPSKPEIQGKYRPNRRSEFFFFDSPTIPISCDEYPKWTGTCSISPPAPTVTVTISPIDSVRKGGTVDTQVTINPSPSFGTQVSLALTTTSGTGEARFAGYEVKNKSYPVNNTNDLIIRESAKVFIRGVTGSSATDNIRLSATELGKPKVLAQEDFTVAAPISIHLQFEVWNLKTRVFEPLPAGVDVAIMDYDPASGNDELARQPTDAKGRVFFNQDRLVDPDEDLPDIFFVVHTNKRTHAGHTLPERWSTKGWIATDGTSGYFEDYAGAPPIGTSSSPAVFRVGLDFHAEIKYRVDGGRRVGTDDLAPKGVLVKLMQERVGPDLELGAFRTDESGRVDAVVFDAEPGSNFYIAVIFEIEDDDIHLRRARFSTVPGVPPIVDVVTAAGPTLVWNSNDSDANRNDFQSHRSTSIGTVSSPEIFLSTLNDRNVALYILKVLREEATFFFQMTGGDWGGVEVAVTPTAPVRAFAWPTGRIQLKFPDNRWDRETVTHEMAHQVMWETVNRGSFGILYQIALGNLVLYHSPHLMANQTQALIEGWAEFVETIFEGVRTPPFSVSSLIDTSGNPVPGGLGPPPNNRGESVEGAFANGLWAILQNHVVTSAVPLDAHVPESANGDIMTTTAVSYLSNTTVRDRFLAMIWNPLKDLRPLKTPTSTDMLNNIRSRNSAVWHKLQPSWHKLQPELQAFNMAMHLPTITTIDPDWGHISGGRGITIKGSNFIARATVTTGAVLETRVDFGGTPATSITVVSSTELTAVPPPRAAGAVDVVVTTPAGSATRANGYIYIDEPLKINDVNPKVVSTSGHQQVTIAGQGFFAEAIVRLDSAPVDSVNVKVESSMIITMWTSPRTSPGAVTVAVENPDGSIDTWSGKLQFNAPPKIHKVIPGKGTIGTTIEIHGDYFDEHIEVVFDNATLAQSGWVNSNLIRISAPNRNGPEQIDGKLTNPDGQSASFTFYLE